MAKYPMHLVQSVLVPKTHRDVRDAKSARVVAERHGAAPGAKLDPEMPNFYGFRMIDPQLARPKAYVSFKSPSGVVTRIARLRPEVMRRAVRRLGGGCDLDAAPRARVVCDEEFVNDQGDRVVVRLTRAEYVAGRRSTSTIERLVRRYGRARVSLVALGSKPHRHRARPATPRRPVAKIAPRAAASRGYSPIARSPFELFSVSRAHHIATFTAIDVHAHKPGATRLRGDAYQFGINVDPQRGTFGATADPTGSRYGVPDNGALAVFRTSATGVVTRQRDGNAYVKWTIGPRGARLLASGTYKAVGRKISASKPLHAVLEKLTHGLGAERFLPQLRRLLTAHHLVLHPSGAWVIAAPGKGKRKRGH